MSNRVFRMGCAVVAAVALTIALGLPAAAADDALTKASTQDYQGIFLRLQKLSADDAARLNEKAKAEYDEGLKWIDKFDYPAAMQHFNKAVDAQPNNMLLRYVAIQMAIYMGNTRKGKQAVEYFDMALTNLNALDTSTQLNSREKERVAKYLDVVGKLKDAVGQRDLMRNKYGRELAKQYAAYVYKKEEKDEKNKTPEQEALERTGAMPQGVGGSAQTETKQKGLDISTFLKRTPRVGALRRGTDIGTKVGPTQVTTEENAAPTASATPGGSLTATQ